MVSRTAEDLERALAAAERKATELQAWADASDSEADQLRARVAELEAAARAPAPAKEDSRVKELQAWVDSAEAEGEKLHARIAELESKLAAKGEDPRVKELQAWVEAEEKEEEALRKRAEEAETEVAVLKHRFELLGGALGEAPQLASTNRELVARVSELEAVNHQLRQLNEELTAQVSGGARRDRERLEAQLAEAKAQGAAERVEALEQLLQEANEAVATLEVQRETAVDQVKRYVEEDTQQHAHAVRDLEDKHRKELVTHERQVAALEAQLAERTDEVSLLHVRLEAHEGEEARLVQEAAAQRERACTAEQSLGALQTEVAGLRASKGDLERRATDLEHKLDEAKRWLAQGELETSDLEKQLEALKTEHAVLVSSAADAPHGAQVPPPPPSPMRPPPPPADATAQDELEGYSAQRLHRLEALLAAEQVKSGVLERYVQTSEESLRRLTDELAAANARLLAMAARLGLAESDTGETLERLDAACSELRALSGQLARAQTELEEAGAEEGPELAPEDVLEAPLEALEQLTQQQATAAKEAAEALAGEQRAREALMHDLTWLKAELEKLSNVREELKQRLASMVQRELKRRAVVAQLLEKLRSTEVAAAARAGTLLRLQAAMELAQKTAVRVQTIYFQKQIGSLQRQLENVLGQRSPTGFLRRRY